MVWVDFGLQELSKNKSCFFFLTTGMFEFRALDPPKHLLQIKQNTSKTPTISVSSTMAFAICFFESLITWLQYFLNEVGGRKCWKTTLLKLELLHCLLPFQSVGDTNSSCAKMLLEIVFLHIVPIIAQLLKPKAKFIHDPGRCESRFCLCWSSVDMHPLHITWWKCLLDFPWFILLQEDCMTLCW